MPMLYNEYEDQCRKLISKITGATNPQTKAKLTLCLANLRVDYYEQFLTEYPDSSNTYKWYKHQWENALWLLGSARDEAFDAGICLFAEKQPESST